jgi:hypothetical protein
MEKVDLPIARREQRLKLLGQLAQSLEEAQRAIVRSDLPGLKQETLIQAQLCAEWRRLEAADCAPAADASDQARTSYLQIEKQTRQIERRVRHLVRVHAALLRGARQSLGVMANLLLRADGTYEPSHSPESALGGHKETMQCRI